MNSNLFNATIDVATILKDAGAITSSAAAQVGGSNRILDLGASVAPTAGMGNAGLIQGNVIVDVSAITTTADNTDRIIIQLSSSSTFASDIINAAILDLSPSGQQLGGATVVGVAGARYVVPVINWQNKVYRRYMRAYTLVGGTSPSINYTAAFVPDKLG